VRTTVALALTAPTRPAVFSGTRTPTTLQTAAGGVREAETPRAQHPRRQTRRASAAS